VPRVDTLTLEQSLKRTLSEFSEKPISKINDTNQLLRVDLKKLEL